MLLAIDAGNTNTVFALFEGRAMVASWRAATQVARTADEYAVFLGELMREKGIDRKKVDAVIIGSVVPEANFNLGKLCRENFGLEPLMVGAKNVETGIKVLLDRPEEIGADRLINAVGGVLKHKPPLLIIDFGTATTFDVVDADGNYIGGAIAPGINLSLQALHMAAAKLPRIHVAPTGKVIAKNTNDAMRSGIYWGYVGLIEGMIARIKSELAQPLTILATGGLAPMFAEAVTGIDHIDDNLTLSGLCEIYDRTRRHSGG